jgi:putative FmdB family regulatory protein
MPLYDYRCQDCGEFSVLRPLSQWRDLASCPDCGVSCERFVSGAPAVSALSSAMNRARAVNERAAHEPRSTRGGPRHGVRLLLRRESRGPDAPDRGRRQNVRWRPALDDQSLNTKANGRRRALHPTSGLIGKKMGCIRSPFFLNRHQPVFRVFIEIKGGLLVFTDTLRD